MKKFEEFAKDIDVSFNDISLLAMAFTHRSYINEHSGEGLCHNERLEFLGDAVLELVVTDYLYHEYPDRPEGELTAFRSSLVNTIMISSAAQDLGMNEYLLLSKGESKDLGKARQYILANTFEAVIGAIYLDQGYDVVREFIAATLFNKLHNIVEKKLYKDAKSWLQELSQEHEKVTPTYTVISEHGPDHDRMFEIGVYFDDNLEAIGKGTSKQEAEQAAARNAIEKRGWMNE